jgi:hypothetical protein
MLGLPSYRELRQTVGKRIALLSACWGQRISFFKSLLTNRVHPWLNFSFSDRLPPIQKQENFLPGIWFYS